jgi:hypothetical protein
VLRSAIPSPKAEIQLVDEYFIENRTRLLEIAAYLDRAVQTTTSAYVPFASRSWSSVIPPRAHAADPADLQRPDRRATLGAGHKELPRGVRPLEGGMMEYTDIHAHMVSRTTDGYQQMEGLWRARKS